MLQGTELSISNALGLAETIKLSTSAGSGGADLLQAVNESAAPLLSGGATPASVGQAKETADRSKQLMALAPSYKMSISKPTFAGLPAPVSVGLRQEVDSHAFLSGFVNEVSWAMHSKQAVGFVSEVN